MRWEKGPHILLDAFAQIVKQVPNVKLLMVGDGPELKKLRAQSVMLNISADTLFIGNKTQKEVFQLYGLIDVVAIPSFFEGFGLTAAEAAAAGIPVVGFDVDGLREVITDRINGVLVKPGHIDQFIHSILMFLQESYSIPNNLSDDSDSLTKFSMATYIRNILKAYNSV
jgi:glycosyltransferase involved in cell wall biosynthesis